MLIPAAAADTCANVYKWRKAEQGPPDDLYTDDIVSHLRSLNLRAGLDLRDFVPICHLHCVLAPHRSVGTVQRRKRRVGGWCRCVRKQLELEEKLRLSRN